MNIVERNGKIILEYGKHLQECTGNLAVEFPFFPFLIIINKCKMLMLFFLTEVTTTVKVGWKTVFYAKRLSVFQLKLISSMFSLLYLLCLFKTLKKLQLWIAFGYIPSGFWLSQCDFAFFLLAKMEHFLLYLFGKLTYNSNSIWIL